MTNDIPWQHRPLLPLRVAGELLGVGKSSLYRLRASGQLTFAKIGGKTYIKTPSLLDYFETSEEWPADKQSRGPKGAQQ